MPYAMSVIVSRAIPEIDGFKPSTPEAAVLRCTKWGLLTGARTKSANIVGADHAPVTRTATPPSTRPWSVSRAATSALLTPFVDSKGNFGKVYSRDMACAASRYTEAKLDAHLRRALPRDRQRDTVDFVDNYDNTTHGADPPADNVSRTFSSRPNMGIAVGMASATSAGSISVRCAKRRSRWARANPEHNLF